jgi:hypothetical protein
MPVTRSGPKQTSLLQKFKAYRATLKNHFEMFGIINIRTLVVMPSRERANNFCKAIMNITDGAGSGLFLHGTYDDFTSGDPLNTLYLTGAMYNTSLISGEWKRPEEKALKSQ